jgi:hypothetical protein
MFEELVDENDLEWTEHRLRVEVMSLKKAGKARELFRVYGKLAHVLARRRNVLKAQDALNDAEFLIVENGWRGSQEEVWCHYDRALVFAELGRSEISRTNLDRAEELLIEGRDEELQPLIETARQRLSQP